MEEGAIRDLWSKYKIQMEEVINDFKYIKLPKASLSTTPGILISILILIGGEEHQNHLLSR